MFTEEQKIVAERLASTLLMRIFLFVNLFSIYSKIRNQNSHYWEQRFVEFFQYILKYGSKTFAIVTEVCGFFFLYIMK